MREVTKNFKVFTFEELSEEVQERLVKEEQERQYEECDDELDYMLEEELSEVFLLGSLSMCYNLSYSQGDGVSLSGVLYDDEIKRLIIEEKLMIDNKYKQIYEDIKNEVSFTYRVGHDSYGNYNFLKVNESWVEDIENNGFYYHLEELLQEYISDSEYTLKHYGYSIIDDLSSEERAFDYLYHDSDTEYLENGSVFYE